MSKIINVASDAVLTLSFHLLFFFVPLFFLPFNFELFEFNKMMAVYFFASLILGAWLIKSITGKKFQIARTPLDIPILLFLASQILSTLFSIDPHLSVFGYYSRFNGGLLSIVTYIFLYYAFVSNFSKEHVFSLLKASLSGGLIVSVWGISEHFGHSFSCFAIQGQFTVSCWVQDVQSRVFATLGQPNWLAAYMAILVPLSLGFFIKSCHPEADSDRLKDPVNIKSQRDSSGKALRMTSWFKSFVYFFLSLLFFSTLLFTKSKSGFLGIVVAMVFFCLAVSIRFKKKIIVPLLFVICSLLFVSFLFGAPIESINRFTLPQLNKTTNNKEQITPITPPPSEGLLESGVTGSDEIRKIVWKGAIDIFKAYPVFGSGVETFAFSYYKFRPVEHNMTSEWDFLYNKAHNEYLNYLATTGSVGIITYFLFILVFIVTVLKWEVRNEKWDTEVGSENFLKSKNQNIQPLHLTSHIILLTSLLCAWLSILVTNFFGFSVVVVQLFFYLIPAMMVVLSSNFKLREIRLPNSNLFFSLSLFLSFSFSLFLFFSVVRGWIADYFYADGYHASRSNEYTRAYDSLKKALSLNSQEPVYYDEFSYAASTVAVGLSDTEDKNLAKSLADEAVLASDTAVSISPSNVNFLKSRTRVFYTLSQIDPNYLDTALSAIRKSRDLSPTDPKVRYNLALIYDGKDKKEEAIREMTTAVKLKPDYKEAYIARALLFSKYGYKEEASASAQFVLDKIDPNDEDAKKIIDQISK